MKDLMKEIGKLMGIGGALGAGMTLGILTIGYAKELAIYLIG